MKKISIIFLLAFIVAPAFAPKALLKRDAPVLIITAEYTPYSKLIEPEVVKLFSRYGISICLCVRDDQLGDELDKLYDVYEAEGVAILLWPLLPMKDGLYLNKHTVEIYLDYLDVLFKWAQDNKHKIEAIVIDIEPSYIPPKPGEEPPGLWKNVKRIIKDLDKKSFNASIPKFKNIVEKLHKNDCLAVVATFPFVIDDKKKGRHGFEDLFGGPVTTVEWDYIAIMMYTSWFVEIGKSLGISWDSAHYLAHDYALDVLKLWGDRGAVAVGVTNPGQGHEKVLYRSADEIAPALSAVRAAGIKNIGIYDLKGILESDDPEAWFKCLNEAEPKIPARGKLKAKMFRNLFKMAGGILELLR